VEKTHRSELERLERLQEQARLGGGATGHRKTACPGEIDARERLDLLFHRELRGNDDTGRSQSRGFGMQEKKVPGDGVAIGYGTVDGRLVFAYAQDATVLGGSVGAIHEKKSAHHGGGLESQGPPGGPERLRGGRLNEGFFASKSVAGMFFRNTPLRASSPRFQHHG